ncbi:MAG TPA: hypothetical protein GX515_09720 [Firmicutes bacterium]|nr:hypothetical protein [Bacillota bacterium]
MSEYTERLEVRLRPGTYRLLREQAYVRGVSMGQLVREALERQYGTEGRAVDPEKQRAMEKLFELEAPVADWLEMKREIEKGRVGE